MTVRPLDAARIPLRLVRALVAALIAVSLGAAGATPAWAQRAKRMEQPAAQTADGHGLGSARPSDAAIGVAGASAGAQVAQRADQPATQSGDGQSSRPSRSTRQLPADMTTDQAVELPGRTLRFKATAGSIPLNDGEGVLQAEVAYVAYVMDGDAKRPVTFVFNGGRGAAPAYLGLGAIGPWRLPLDRVAVSPPPTLQPNAESWLDFTDLVFIDPPGTGYSRIAASGEDARRR